MDYRKYLSDLIDGEKNKLDIAIREIRVELEKGRDIVIYGAGYYGEMIARKLRSNGVRATAFVDVDDRKRDTLVQNIKVLSPSAAAKGLSKDSLIIVSLYQAYIDLDKKNEILRMLDCYGFINVAIYPAFFYWDPFCEDSGNRYEREFCEKNNAAMLSRQKKRTDVYEYSS